MENETNNIQTQQQNSVPQNNKKSGGAFKIIVIIILLLLIVLGVIVFKANKQRSSNAPAPISAQDDKALKKTTPATSEYQKAVSAIKIREAKAYMKFIQDAELRHLLMNDSYTNKFSELDIEFENASGNTLDMGDLEIKIEAPNLVLKQKGSSEKGYVVNMETKEESCQGNFC